MRSHGMAQDQGSMLKLSQPCLSPHLGHLFSRNPEISSLAISSQDTLLSLCVRRHSYSTPSLQTFLTYIRCQVASGPRGLGSLGIVFFRVIHIMQWTIINRASVSALTLISIPAAVLGQSPFIVVLWRANMSVKPCQTQV